jgi:hypothetical protein
MWYIERRGDILENSIKPLVLLVLTQAMIFLGEIQNPMTGRKEADLASASRYIGLLTTLEKKTRGNLDEGENQFLMESLHNLSLVYNKKAGLDQGLKT